MATHKVTLRVPDNAFSKVRIGKHRIEQLRSRSFIIDAELEDEFTRGYWTVKSELKGKLASILLKKQRSHAQEMGAVNVMKLQKAVNPSEINEFTRLSWVSHVFPTEAPAPNAILESWRDTLRFKLENRDKEVLGFRSPQLGAIHAIAAHCSLPPREPATVVLPTGTGKTDTMIASLVYLRCRRLLVIVPSKALRKQIARKFLELGVLPEVGAVPSDACLPSVCALSSGLQSIEEARVVANASSVCVSTVNALKEAPEHVREVFLGSFSHLFIDEAHHVASDTWAALRDSFEERHIVQFTATPFRNDGKSLGGRIIYNFTMGDAQRAGYFKHIRLIPVEEYYEDEQDRVIATRALQILRDDLDSGLNHVLMARVERVSRAVEILPIYEELAEDLAPVIVHNRMTMREQEAAIHAIQSGDSKVIVCVKMLGEGFDLPSLKIAAIHDHHKSLPITLQFIGRFIRKQQGVGEAAAVVNVARPEVEKALSALYAHGAEWDSILRRLSEDTVQRQIELQDVVDDLRGMGDLTEQISLWNVRPSLSSVIFRVTNETWNTETISSILPKETKNWVASSTNRQIAVMLAIDESGVRWGDYKDLVNHVYHLLIVYRCENRKALFVFASDHNFFRTYQLADSITEGGAVLFDDKEIFKVFDNVQLPLVRNLGASRIGAISFTQYFGANVTDGLAEIEKSQSNLSNIAAFGYEDGDRVVWGCSQKKGKIWTAKKGTITDWTDWCQLAWDKITSEREVEENVTTGFLRPESIDSRHESVPLSAHWGEHLLQAREDRASIFFGELAVPLYLVDVQINSYQMTGPIAVRVSSNELDSVYSLHISSDLPGGYRYELTSGEPIRISRSPNRIDFFEDYMVVDPVVVHYVDGCFSYNKYLIRSGEFVDEYPVAQIETREFPNIHMESMGMDREEDSIQYQVFSDIEDDYRLVFNDDGKGEAADLVAFREDVDGNIVMALIHCKYSTAETPRALIGDMHEVCSQCQRSTHWKHRGISRLTTHLLRRNRRWRDLGRSRFLKGSESDLEYFEKKSRTASTKLEMLVVQPGLSKAAATGDILQLLGSTELYVRKTTNAKLRVVSSP